MCGLCGGTWVDAVGARVGAKVDGGEFSFERNAEGWGLCDSAHVGRWPWEWNLFVGLFAEDCASDAMKGRERVGPAGKGEILSLIHI